MENIMQEAWERAKKEQKEQKEKMAKTNMRIVGKEEEEVPSGKRSLKWKETWARRNEQYKAKSVAITEALMCIMLYKKKYFGVPLHVGGNKISGICYKVFSSYKRGFNLTLESICIVCGAYDVKLDLKVKDPKLSEDLIKIEKDIIQINMKKGYSVDKILDRVFLAKLQYLLARLKIKEGYTTADMAAKYDLNPHSLGAILDPRSRIKQRNPYNYSIITLLGMTKIVGATVTISLLNGKPAVIKKSLLTEYNNCVLIGKRYTTGTRERESDSNANFDLNPSFYYKSMIPFEERNPDIRFEDTILKKVLVKSDNIDLGIKPTYDEEDKPELNEKKVETVPVFQPEVNSVDDTLTDTHTEESPVEHKEEPKEVASIEQVEVAIGGVTVTVPANIVDKDGKKVIRLAIDIAIK